MVREGHNHPTEFEVVTAIAFQYYCDLECDCVILEVGLGGRFDATNVIEKSLISIITSISMDHMEWLGDTIGKIAYEKCGIIKENGLVVVYPEQEPDAQEVIDQVVSEKNANMIKVDSSTAKVISNTIEGITFDYDKYKALNIRLLGEHQVLNAMTAITVAELLNNRYHLEITEEHIKRGLGKTLWPGRLEVLSHEPLFLIDGAHNMSGVRALSRAMKRYACTKQIIFIIGILRDKEYEDCLAELGRIADTVITTTPLNNRAVPADELGHIAKKYCSQVYVEHQIAKAIARGIGISGSNNAICCCGSLYLVGEVRKILKETYK
jgi:dihydrofolate synthase/folylpolyglutamate synthase